MPWNELYTYWLSKHDGDRPPSRTALDPVGEIPHLVQNLILIEILPEGYRFRLEGSEVVRRSGYDLTGRMFDERLYDPGPLAKWTAALNIVREQQRPVLIRSSAEHRRRAEMLVLALPLVAPGGSTEMLMLGGFYEGDFENVQVRDPLELIDLPFMRKTPR
jgi:hypothetical protein